MKFAGISREEHRDWLMSDVTKSAVEMLREMHAIATNAVTSEAVSAGASLHSIGITAGIADGISRVIDQLTRPHS